MSFQWAYLLTRWCPYPLRVKLTAPGIPKRSPIQILTRPDPGFGTVEQKQPPTAMIELRRIFIMTPIGFV